jgi:hypothetical protein
MELSDLKTTAEVLSSAVTTTAVIVAGVWTYFKFIKGRGFRPHVDMAMSALWVSDGETFDLVVTLRLKNIGSSKVELIQKGTGIQISRMADKQSPAPTEAHWDSVGGVFEVFVKHEWIEPSEAIEDELLVRMPCEPQVLQLESRVVLAWKRENISVHSRRVVTPRLAHPPWPLSPPLIED